jgi:hypothetical protein
MFTDERIISDRYLAHAARYLTRLAQLDGGYTLRGVSGWAHRHQVERGTHDHQDGQLPRLHAIGFADRVNLGLGKSEAWVYRITDEGARASAETWGDAYERVRVPGAMENPAPVYLAPGPRNALEVLRLAFEAEGGPRRFEEHGWSTGRELTVFLEDLNRKRNGAGHLSRIDSMELKWLADVGLVEKRNQQFAWGRDRPVVCWRVSEAGRTVRLLSWRAPRSEDWDESGEEER